MNLGDLIQSGLVAREGFEEKTPVKLVDQYGNVSPAERFLIGLELDGATPVILLVAEKEKLPVEPSFSAPRASSSPFYLGSEEDE